MPSSRLCRAALALLAATFAACSSAAGGGAAATQSIPAPAEDSTLQLVRARAIPITGAPTDYDSLMALVGDARFVLLGEATHGSDEFYRERARITQRLIQEKGFSGVAIEGQWPHAMHVHRFVRGEGPATPDEALRGFTTGFPEWMWSNTAIRDLAVWMRQHNQGRAPGQQAGFYGLDVYSLFESADSVIAYLRRADPAAAERARQRYACVLRHRGEPARYGMEATSNPARSCEDEAREQVQEVEQLYVAVRGGDPRLVDERFSVLQHARIVAGGEAYWRAQWEGGPASWNQRDRHMAETLEYLVAHQASQGQTARIVVWAHNTHSGDARLTEMGQGGEWNVGQLMRQAFEGESVLVGFTTYHGTVLAAEEWDAPGRVRRLNPALPESYSGLFHRAGIPAFMLLFRSGDPLTRALGTTRLERAVGVVYAPRTERQSHYFNAILSQQFDAVIHVDSTTAVTPVVPPRR